MSNVARSALRVLAVDLAVAVVVHAVAADLTDSATHDCRVGAGAGVIAGVRRARIAIVTLQSSPTCAGTGRADVTAGADIAVVACRGVVHERAALGRVTRVRCAGVVVIADDVAMSAVRLTCASIERTLVAVIARD